MRKYLFILLLTLITINCFSKEDFVSENYYLKDLNTFHIETGNEIEALNDFLGAHFVEYTDGKKYISLESYLSYTCNAYIYLKTIKQEYKNVKNLCEDLIVRYQKVKGI